MDKSRRKLLKKYPPRQQEAPRHRYFDDEEELGRVEAERAYTPQGKRDLRDEKYRIREELKNGGSSMPEHYLEHGYGPHKKRKGKAAGSIVKGGIKAGKRFLDFIKTGKHVDKKGVKTNVPKAAERLTGKPHVDRVKKAVGGSIDHKPKWPPKGWQDYKPREWPRGPEKSLIERAGGSEKGKPHSTKEGRTASGKRKINRFLSRYNRYDPSRPTLKGGPQYNKYTGKRTGKGVGGIIKGAIKAAKTVAAPGTHIKNVASGIKHGATKLIKGVPKIAKRGWK